MKAVTDPMSFLVLSLIGLIFLALGFALFYGILKGAPNQLAFASTQRLASAIQEACITGDEVDVELSLQQSKPLIKSFVGIPLRVFAESKMREFGDPDFVLYYEMFPPGEGIGWEVYHEFEPHGVVVVPQGHDGDSAQDIETLLQNARQKIRQRHHEVEDAPVVVSNIVLTPDIDLTTGKKVPEEEKKDFFGFGEWSVDPQGTDVFRFTNYKDLERLDKTLVKYMACGENDLCLKTNEGVYAFPLTHCNGIKTIEFSHDKSGLAKIGRAFTETIKEAPEYAQLLVEADLIKNKGNVVKSATELRSLSTKAIQLAKAHPLVAAAVAAGTITYAGLTNYFETAYEFRDGDLGLASPCYIKGKVKLTDCEDKYRIDPIYTYNPNTDKLELIKGDDGQPADHYTSLDELSGDLDVDEKKIRCIRIDIDEKRDHCYTYNLDRGTVQTKLLLTMETIADPAQFILDAASKIPGVGGIFGSASSGLTFDNYVVEPIRSSTEYFDGVYLLTQGAPLSVIEEAFNNIVSAETPTGYRLTPFDPADQWWWP